MALEKCSVRGNCVDAIGGGCCPADTPYSCLGGCTPRPCSHFVIHPLLGHRRGLVVYCIDLTSRAGYRIYSGIADAR
eukprot:6895978-Prymnesium_polylepis.1